MPAVTVDRASDVDLLVRTRYGDSEADARLLERHRDAVAGLGDSPAFRSVDASGRTALALVRQGADGDLPFRAVWLAMHAQGCLPLRPAAAGVVWDGFLALPPAWRTALWHREVEGARLEEVARLLDMDEQQATRALTSAYAALKRRIALAHPTPQATGVCAELRDTYRFSPPATLPAAEVRALREHGRHCDDCLGLIRDLLLVEHTLRSTLAAAVLGRTADDYLAGRPQPRRLRTPGAEVVHAERRRRPMLAGMSAASAAAAAMALVLSTPAISPAGPTPPDASAAIVPDPGHNLWPAMVTLTSGDVRSTTRAVHRPLVFGVGELAVGSSSPADGGTDGGPGSSSSPTDPATPEDSGTPAEPAVPAEPTGPSGPSEPPAEPPATPDGDNGTALDVQVDLDGASITVDVQPGSGEPIEVEVPVPGNGSAPDPEDSVDDLTGALP